MSYLDSIGYYSSNNRNLGSAGITTRQPREEHSKNIARLANLVIDGARKQRIINRYEHFILIRYVIHLRRHLGPKNCINALPIALLLVNFRTYLGCAFNCATFDSIKCALDNLYNDKGLELQIETVSALKPFLMYCLDHKMICDIEKFQIFLLDRFVKRYNGYRI